MRRHDLVHVFAINSSELTRTPVANGIISVSEQSFKRAEGARSSEVTFSTLFLDVMLNNALSARNICTAYSSLYRLILPYIRSRTLSTNSAIRKGLRKATNSRSRLDPPARVGGITRKKPDHRNDGRSDFRDRSFKLPSRHIAGKDSSMARKPKNVPLKGRKSVRTSHDVHNTRNIDVTQREATSRADFVRERDRSIVQKNATTSTTRAERRAALFGHKENPPEGYKGLPSRSAASQRLPENSDEGRRLRFLSSLSRERTGRQTRHVQRNSRAHDDSRPIERSLTRAMTESKTDGASVNTRDKYDWASTPGQRHGLNDLINQPRDSIEERPRRKTNAPLAIPYTTPASEFLYGHSVVTMALKSSRRTFYKLYLYDGDAAEVRGQDKQVRKLALAANVEVTRVGNDWLKLMDKMSGGRPHNVCFILH